MCCIVLKCLYLCVVKGKGSGKKRVGYSGLSPLAFNQLPLTLKSIAMNF